MPADAAGVREVTHLGKYRILGQLGRGAMGVVYKGFDPRIERTVAIKTMRGLAESDDPQAGEARERFEREAKAAGRLSHPGIVAVYDFGEDGETAFIVMELVEGKVLKDLLAEGTPFPVAQAASIMSKVLAALDYSHRMAVIHRDIKPGNIIVTAEGEVKIMDFGIAKFASTTMTQTGTILGTPSYMSPEQFTGDAVDRQSDIFSAGAVLYELLTGRKAFSGSFTTVMQQVLNVVPPDPSSLRTELPAALDAVLRKALAKRPEDRYQSAADFARDLAAAATPTGLAAKPAPLPGGRRNWIIGGSAAAALGVTGGLAWWLLSPPPRLPVAGDEAPWPVVTPATAAAGTVLTVTTERGPAPRYAAGEAVQLVATLSADGFLYCFYHPETGGLFRIFPNRYAPGAFQRAGTTVRVPGDAPFAVHAGHKGAKDQAGCIATAADPAAALPVLGQVPELLPLPFDGLTVLAAAIEGHLPGRTWSALLDVTVMPE